MQIHSFISTNKVTRPTPSSTFPLYTSFSTFRHLNFPQSANRSQSGDQSRSINRDRAILQNLPRRSGTMQPRVLSISGSSRSNGERARGIATKGHRESHPAISTWIASRLSSLCSSFVGGKGDRDLVRPVRFE